MKPIDDIEPLDTVTPPDEEEEEEEEKDAVADELATAERIEQYESKSSSSASFFQRRNTPAGSALAAGSTAAYMPADGENAETAEPVPTATDAAAATVAEELLAACGPEAPLAAAAAAAGPALGCWCWCWWPKSPARACGTACVRSTCSATK
jgi:hypothetical protein